MFRKSKNLKTTFFVAVALLAVVSLWAGLSLGSAYLSYAFQQEDNSEVPSGSDSFYDKKEPQDPVEDPYITKAPEAGTKKTEPQVNSSDPVLGNSQAPVTIVQYSDFECEYCHQQEKILQEIKDKYKDKIRLVWKDFPDNDPRSASWQAAKAARCAQQQDKFWSYHNRIYQTEKNLDQKTFLELALKEGLNRNEFKDCLNSPQMNELIRRNIEEANSLGIMGIPFLYINEREIMGKISKKELEKMVEMELQE